MAGSAAILAAGQDGANLRADRTKQILGEPTASQPAGQGKTKTPH